MTSKITKARAAELMDRLDPLYRDLTTGLAFSTPFELLVATILSAQCTDERVNGVTPILFGRFRSAGDFAIADPAEIQAIIYSLGFFRNKTKNIQGMAQVLVRDFEGQVPDTMADLLRLPGVARKTANVVLAHAFGRNEGIAVDTHVQRLSGRLGLSSRKDPVRIEQDLMYLVPRERWGRLSDVLIWHGRKVCHARSPACNRCILTDLCPSALRV